MNYRLMILSLLSTVTMACTSLTEKGQKALGEGKYDEAVSYFEQALQSNDRDGEAREGLRRSQQGYLGRKLIEVRLLRLGNNFADSEALLLDLINKENQWRVFPDGVAFSTQNEEIKLFAERVQRRIQEAILKKNPLEAEFELRKNNFIIEKALTQNISSIKHSIYSAAVNFCRDSLKDLKPQDYFSGLWLQQTCGIWKVPLKLPALQTSVSFFNEVNGKSSVQGLSPALTTALDKNIRDGFLQSKWFDPKGKGSLDLSLKGKFTAESSEHERGREASYTVQIPYEESSRRVKSTKSSNNGLFGLLSFVLGSGSSERVRDNGDGTETVTVTKYRPEIRYYSYKAWEVKAHKLLDGELTAGLGGGSFKQGIAKEYSFKEDRHNESFPDAGLSPSSAVFATDEQWINGIGGEITQSLTHELQLFWLERYCLPLPLKNSTLSEPEQIQRCAYQVTNTVPEILQQYYLKTYRIRFEDWKGLLN